MGNDESLWQTFSKKLNIRMGGKEEDIDKSHRWVCERSVLGRNWKLPLHCTTCHGHSGTPRYLFHFYLIDKHQTNIFDFCNY